MKANQDNQIEPANTPPIHSANCGRVRASVWENSKNGDVEFKVILSCSIKKNGEWTRGKTFFHDELPAVIEVAARAQRWIEWRKREMQSQLNLATA